MSMVYCDKCDRMIDLDYDSDHECFVEKELKSDSGLVALEEIDNLVRDFKQMKGGKEDDERRI